MPSARVTFNPTKDIHISVVGHGTIRNDGSGTGFAASLEVAGPARALELQAALRRFAKYYEADETGAEVPVMLSHVAARHFDEDFGPMEPVGLALTDGDLLVAVQMFRESPIDHDAVEALLAPFLSRRKAQLVSIHESPMDDPHQLVTVNVAWPLSRRTVDDLYAFGSEVLALLEAADGGVEIEHAAALDLLEARRWDLFKGQPESAWLEAKGKPYDLYKPKARFELAKDVAAFANSPHGGLIVLGMTTTDAGDGDIITGHRLISLADVKRQRYRNIIAQHVYPTIQGFEVRRIADSDGSGRGLVVLIIPAQRREAVPFLVSGVVEAKSTLGAHVLLPVRREDYTSYLDASAIHARLRLGEQVLSGQWPPAA